MSIIIQPAKVQQKLHICKFLREKVLRVLGLEVQECLGFMRQAACFMCRWHLFQCFEVIKHLMRPKIGISVYVATLWPSIIYRVSNVYLSCI